MKLEEQLIGKLSPKTIGYHLGNYADLFVQPVRTWKRIMSPRSSSYDLLILHLIYYTLFSYFVFRDLTVAIPVVITEVVMTVLPWLALVIPFKYFIKRNKKRIKSIRLFRLLLIVKLQCAPILVILFLIAKYTRHDIFYIIFDNLIWIYFVLAIIVLPLTVDLRLRERIAWIFANYVFFLISMSLFFLIVLKTSVMERIDSRTPTSEYLDFKIESSHSRMFIDDSYYLLFAIMRKEDSSFILRPQFASHNLISSFLKKESNFNKNLLLKLDTSFAPRDSPKLFPMEEELTLEQAKDWKKAIDSIFYHDLNLVNELKDSAYFPSNKDYFKTLYAYLKGFESTFTNSTEIKEIATTQKALAHTQFNDSVFGFLYLDSLRFKPSRLELSKMEDWFERRFDYSSFTMHLLLFPVLFLGEFIEI